jgi:hypothetical protein
VSLDEIRARVEAAKAEEPAWKTYDELHADLDYLLALVDAQREEIARLSMTPMPDGRDRERAREAMEAAIKAQGYRVSGDGGVTFATYYLENAITAALTRARDEEREACAQIADGCVEPSSDIVDTGRIWRSGMALHIAQQIRQRRTPGAEERTDG